MLVSFAVTNYACFRDRQEFSAEAVSRTPDSRAFDTGVPSIPRLNRASAIYGPNGSGKSRFVAALAFMRQFVQTSASETQLGDSIDVVPYKFDAKAANKPTTFEIAFIQEGTTYEYGFSADRKRVHTEWLLARPPGGRLRRLLERTYDPPSNTYKCWFGPSVRGPKSIWRSSTRENALVASTAAQLNSATFEPVIKWFLRKLQVVTSDTLSPAYTISTLATDASFKARVLELLSNADISVADILARSKQVSLDELAPTMPPQLVDHLLEQGTPTINMWEALFAHEVAGAHEPVLLDLEEESDGTKRLLSLAGPWIDVLTNDMVVVIDELDRSLHPLLVSSLIRTINSDSPNIDREDVRAQLVTTVHGVTPLRDVLHRGQIWFAEKDRQHEAATLTPLSDYRPRRDESVMKDYLDGRYGALPVLADLDSLE